MDGWLSVCECRLGVDLLNPKRLAHFKLQNAYKRRRRRGRSNLNLEIVYIEGHARMLSPFLRAAHPLAIPVARTLFCSNAFFERKWLRHMQPMR
jgi:hypothetical protein